MFSACLAQLQALRLLFPQHCTALFSTVAAHQRAAAHQEMHCEGEEAGGAAIWRLRRLLHSAAIVDGAGAPPNRLVILVWCVV